MKLSRAQSMSLITSETSQNPRASIGRGSTQTIALLNESPNCSGERSLRSEQSIHLFPALCATGAKGLLHPVALGFQGIPVLLPVILGCLLRLLVFFGVCDLLL